MISQQDGSTFHDRLETRFQLARETATACHMLSKYGKTDDPSFSLVPDEVHDVAQSYILGVTEVTIKFTENPTLRLAYSQYLQGIISIDELLALQGIT